jgi:hypothetical protein
MSAAKVVWLAMASVAEEHWEQYVVVLAAVMVAAEAAERPLKVNCQFSRTIAPNTNHNPMEGTICSMSLRVQEVELRSLTLTLRTSRMSHMAAAISGSKAIIFN